jgi:hypothetical protein
VKRVSGCLALACLGTKALAVFAAGGLGSQTLAQTATLAD